MSNFKIYLKAILIPLIVGSVIGFITSGAMDISILRKPPLAPPGVLFPIVWTILYTLMGISYGVLDSNSLIDTNVKNIYYAQLIVNALWSIFFFTFKWRFFSFLWIILLLVLVINMIIKFYNKNKLAGLLQTPYVIWVAFATYLNLGIYLLNR